MDGSYWIGAVLVAIGAVLVFVGMPNKNGQSPRFLRFGAAISIYPGLIMIFLAMGAAELFMAAG